MTANRKKRRIFTQNAYGRIAFPPYEHWTHVHKSIMGCTERNRKSLIFERRVLFSATANVTSLQGEACMRKERRNKIQT
jgi:hypothetical protein